MATARRFYVLQTLLMVWLLSTAEIPATAQGVRMVTVVGCATRGTDVNTWTLTYAVESETGASADSVIEAQPGTADEIARAADAVLGDLTYRLIGTNQYNLDDHDAHRLLVKGLLISVEDKPRLNVTSIQHVSSACAEK